MLRGLYSAALGLRTQQKRHDAAINNLSNIETPGYKKDQSIIRTFPEELQYRIGKYNGLHPHAPTHSRASTINTVIPPRVGYLPQGVIYEESIASFAMGNLKQTDNQFDLAIIDENQQQKGFFAVKKDLDSDEVVYTKAGNFRLRDIEGIQYLTTQDGEYVMQRMAGGELEPIQVMGDKLTVYTNGMFEIDEPGFLPTVGQIHLVQFNNDQLPGLAKEGHGLYRINEQLLGAGFQPEEADNIFVQQYFIEGSNVDPMQAMVDMMTAQRAYEANQRVLQTYDRSLEKSVNEVGKV